MFISTYNKHLPVLFTSHPPSYLLQKQISGMFSKNPWQGLRKQEEYLKQTSDIPELLILFLPFGVNLPGGNVVLMKSECYLLFFHRRVRFATSLKLNPRNRPADHVRLPGWNHEKWCPAYSKCLISASWISVFNSLNSQDSNIFSFQNIFACQKEVMNNLKGHVHLCSHTRVRHIYAMCDSRQRGTVTDSEDWVMNDTAQRKPERTRF